MQTSLPIDFTRRIRSQFGKDADELLIALDSEPSVSVRYNPGKPIYSGGMTDQVPWCKEGVYLPERPVFTLDPLFHAGCYYPQESSSMFLHFVLTQLYSDHNDILALDLCAAPGGKTTLLTSFLDGGGVVVANEVIRSRVPILKENVIKWGYSNVMVTANDPANFSVTGPVFDLVLVDAPCSGEGMFRKDMAARSEWSGANAQACALRQKRILNDIWGSVREGGYLIYSTCTFNPDENELNVEWLLNTKNARLINFPVPQEWKIDEIDIGTGVGYAFYPHHSKGEGFFLAVVQKIDSEDSVVNSFKPIKALPLKVPEGLLKEQSRFVFFPEHESLLAIPQPMSSFYGFIRNHFKVCHAGIEVGRWLKDEFIPLPGLALSNCLSVYYQSIPLSRQQALYYLRGETNLAIDASKGWYTVSFEGHPLGFIKSVGSRINNYFPKEWRIKMRV